MRSTRLNAARPSWPRLPEGGCGGRLHGICGSIFDDNNENHRICSACIAKAGKRKAPAADSAGKAQTKRPKAYGELPSHIGVLEAAAEDRGDRGNGDAALYLAKAKMAMMQRIPLSGCARQT